MNTVLAVGFQLEWGLSVFVKDGLDDRPINGPRQALKYLEDELAIRSGHSYWNAIAACSGALRYRCNPEIARTCFIAAYADYLGKLKY